MACAPQQRLRSAWASIRVFAVRMKKAWVVRYPLSAQQRLCSGWADAQTDLSLRWAHMPFCWFCRALAQNKVKIPRKCHNHGAQPRSITERRRHDEQIMTKQTPQTHRRTDAQKRAATEGRPWNGQWENTL